MNIFNIHKKSKYTVAIATVLIATSAVAAGVKVLTPLHAPNTIPKATPTDSFVLNDGTATKEISQLEWARCLAGQTFTNGECTGKATEYATWEDALKAPTPQQAADGWRVPNIKELMRITENTAAYPAINTEVFPFALSFEFAQADDYYALAARPSSPFLWSSTPTIDKTPTQNPKTFQDYTPEEYKQQLEKDHLNSNKVYALDLGLGQTEVVYRDGKSLGEHFTGQYGNNDPDNVKKARYVLLVKDIS